MGLFDLLSDDFFGKNTSLKKACSDVSKKCRQLGMEIERDLNKSFDDMEKEFTDTCFKYGKKTVKKTVQTVNGKTVSTTHERVTTTPDDKPIQEAEKPEESIEKSSDVPMSAAVPSNCKQPISGADMPVGEIIPPDYVIMIKPVLDLKNDVYINYFADLKSFTVHEYAGNNVFYPCSVNEIISVTGGARISYSGVTDFRLDFTFANNDLVAVRMDNLGVSSTDAGYVSFIQKPVAGHVLRANGQTIER